MENREIEKKVLERKLILLKQEIEKSDIKLSERLDKMLKGINYSYEKYAMDGTVLENIYKVNSLKKVLGEEIKRTEDELNKITETLGKKAGILVIERIVKRDCFIAIARDKDGEDLAFEYFDTSEEDLEGVGKFFEKWL